MPGVIFGEKIEQLLGNILFWDIFLWEHLLLETSTLKFWGKIWGKSYFRDIFYWDIYYWKIYYLEHLQDQLNSVKNLYLCHQQHCYNFCKGVGLGHDNYKTIT